MIDVRAKTVIRTGTAVDGAIVHAMGKLAELSKYKVLESYVVTAIPVGATLYVAFNIRNKSSGVFVGSAVLAVDLATLEPTIVYETGEAMIDYVLDPTDGWQCLVMEARIVEIDGGKPLETVTKDLPVGLYRMSYVGKHRVAICGDDGQVALYDKKKLTKVKVDTSEELVSLFVATTDRAYVVGSYGTFLQGSVKSLKQVWPEGKPNPFDADGGRIKVLSVYETKSGAVLLGGEGRAVVYDQGKVTKLGGLDDDEAGIYAMVELGGTEYWSASGNALYIRKGTKLVKQAAEAGGYRMEADGKTLASSCGSFVYLFDGKTWMRLRININVKKLVEKLKLDF